MTLRLNGVTLVDIVPVWCAGDKWRHPVDARHSIRNGMESDSFRGWRRASSEEDKGVLRDSIKVQPRITSRRVAM